ncbi:MaoC family dehydratase (plasmid) [Deinococcus taeanensis]|uniref:MaoC family dehydratase n=1 Tax=Deinococcus taeanensis TaxID=2737050 RepID=UPI001CDD681D|nr:MaoC family dehydratase [Deinococcus taeanensis]UBV45133.1 MaoC family dehydratase [Deinococcus taeanensis]
MKPQDLQAHVGQQVALSAWTEITQERINAFAAATGDHQFIHVDAERAAQGPFGTTIAHGFLTLSLLAGDFMSLGGAPQIEGARLTVNYGLNRVRFITPVRSGARLRNRAVLQAAEPGAGFVQITVANTIEIEGEARPACTAESVFRVYL